VIVQHLVVKLVAIRYTSHDQLPHLRPGIFTQQHRPGRISFGRGTRQNIWVQWRRQLWGTGARASSTASNFIFSSLWSKSDSHLSKYRVVYEISWCRCQQLTALSISTALVTKLLIIEQLNCAVSAP